MTRTRTRSSRCSTGPADRIGRPAGVAAWPAPGYSGHRVRGKCVMDVRVKICGLTRAEDVTAAARSGAAYGGFVFFEKSPRNLAPAAARELALLAPGRAGQGRALVVDRRMLCSTRSARGAAGHAAAARRESPERVAVGPRALRAAGDEGGGSRPRRTCADHRFEALADQILVDAKPPRGRSCRAATGLPLTGGWLRAGAGRPWMLAGGLTPKPWARPWR